MDMPDIGLDFAKLAIVLVVSCIVILVGINITGQLSTLTVQGTTFDPFTVTAGDSEAGHDAGDANDDSTSTYWEDSA